MRETITLIRPNRIKISSADLGRRRWDHNFCYPLYFNVLWLSGNIAETDQWNSFASSHFQSSVHCHVTTVCADGSLGYRMVGTTGLFKNRTITVKKSWQAVNLWGGKLTDTWQAAANTPSTSSENSAIRQIVFRINRWGVSRADIPIDYSYDFNCGTEKF
jgi:hypothetical protein